MRTNGKQCEIKSVAESLLRPINIPRKTLLGPGPSNVSEDVLKAMSQPLLGHLHPEFCKIMDDCKEGIKYVFQTNNDYTFAVSGTGHAALECAIVNMVEPGDTVLVATNGIWGARAADMITRAGGCAKEIKVQSGNYNFSPGEIESGIKEHNPKLLFITHGESSTGVVQPLDHIGEICRRHNCLLLVDTVASLGGNEIYMDNQEIDIMYTGPQKVLSCPPGPSPISFGPRAVEKLKTRKSPVQSFYFDANQLANYWGCDGAPRRYHHTGMINNIYALREALRLFAMEGLERSWARHQQNTRLLHSMLEKRGFELYVVDKDCRLATVTTIKIPPHVDFKSLSSKIMKKHSIEISPGLGPSSGKAFRIGLMGVNSTSENVYKVCDAISEAMKDLKAEANL